jgi:hypothetical protein
MPIAREILTSEEVPHVLNCEPTFAQREAVAPDEAG